MLNASDWFNSPSIQEKKNSVIRLMFCFLFFCYWFFFVVFLGIAFNDIETVKSSTIICVISITLLICCLCGKVTQYFPISFLSLRINLLSGQVCIQPRGQSSISKFRLSRAWLPDSDSRPRECQLFGKFGQLL